MLRYNSAIILPGNTKVGVGRACGYNFCCVITASQSHLETHRWVWAWVVLPKVAVLKPCYNLTWELPGVCVDVVRLLTKKSTVPTISSGCRKTQADVD